LRLPEWYGYAAQEFISADAESSSFGSTAPKFEMTVPVKKAGSLGVRLFPFIASRIPPSARYFARAR
jgi:hypothetical protein